MRYFITGFMGSGKSTIAQLLADELQLSAYDLDVLIEKQSNSSVANIFAEKGESHFRELERIMLQQSIQEYSDFILSTGGGTPCFNESADLMKNAGKVIYLDAPPHVLLERLLKATNSRPLLAGLSEEEMLEFIILKLKERLPYYKKSDLIIDANQSPDQVVQHILDAIQEEKWL